MWGSLFIFVGLVILSAGSFFDGHKQGLLDSDVNGDLEKTKGELLFTFGAVFIMLGVIINITNKFDTMFLASGIMCFTIGMYFVGKMEALKKYDKPHDVDKVRGYVLSGFGAFFIVAGYFMKLTGVGKPPSAPAATDVADASE